MTSDACEASAGVPLALSQSLCVALDRRVTVKVSRNPGRARFESRDRPQRLEGERLSLLELDGELRAVARVLAAAGLDRDVEAVAHCRVPRTTGLDLESAAAIAAAAAAAALTGSGAGPAESARLAARALFGEQPGSTLALWTSALGGVVTLAAGGQARRLGVDPAWLDECLLLADSGSPAGTETAGFEAGPAPAEGDGLAAALASRASPAVARAIASGWEALRSQGRVGPAVERIVALVGEHGGAARPCRPGAGGLVAVWIPAERRAPLLAGLREAGARTFPCRVDLLGVEWRGPAPPRAGVS